MEKLDPMPPELLLHRALAARDHGDVPAPPGEPFRQPQHVALRARALGVVEYEEYARRCLH
jgi:hypothetical protein